MEYKILFTGTMGAGKTTAIQQIAQEPPVQTDVFNTRQDQADKATTTAAFDFGELDLGEGDTLRLYGTPGQQRFDFMWPILARGALGIVYLVDAQSASPLDDLEAFIEAFGAEASQVPSVVGLNKGGDDAAMMVDSIQDYLDSRQLALPVLATDVRNREQTLSLLELILGMNEAVLQE